MLYTLLTILFLIDALFLILFIIVLQQGSENSGLGGFGGGNASGILGATGGVRFLVRATWILGIIFFILGLSIAWLQTHNRHSFGQSIEKSLMDTQPNSLQK